MAMIPYVYLSDNPSCRAPDGVVVMSSAQLQQQESDVDGDFFLIDGSDVDAAWRLLESVRQHVGKSMYLKPVLLEDHGSCLEDELLVAAVDAVWKAGRDGALLAGELEVLINGINSRLRGILQNPLVLGDQQSGFRLLRYIASRNSEQKPHITSRRTIGYSYPQLETFFAAKDDSVWHVLELLEQQQMLTTRFVSRSFQCVHCKSSFLNFVETCPDCKAVNIESDDLIHHFRCGYAAASREFLQGDEMICPKCTHTLKQIGVDYDKPSLTFRCRECQYVFEEPFVSTICYHCGRRTDPDHQIQRDIFAYTITALGENAALFGPEQMFQNILGKELNVVDFEAFTKIVDVEKARIERYKLSKSSLLVVQIGAFAAAMAELGQRSMELYQELAHIFSLGLRTSDVISTRGQSLFVMLLVETAEEPSKIALQRVAEPTEALFQDSVSMSADISSLIVSVNKSLNLNQVIESFLAQGD